MTSKLREMAEKYGKDRHILATRERLLEAGYIDGFLEGAKLAWEAARRRTPIDTDNEITLERLTYLNLNNWLKTMEE